MSTEQTCSQGYFTDFESSACMPCPKDTYQPEGNCILISFLFNYSDLFTMMYYIID